MITLAHVALDDDTSGYFPQLAKWHDRSRYRMVFVTLRPTAERLRAEMDRLGVECFSPVCRGRWDYPMGLARLVRFFRSRRVEVAHTHLFDPSVVGLTAAALAGVRVRLMTRHYSDYHTRIGKHWHTRLDRLCTALSHKVIAVSAHTAEFMRAEEGAPPGRLRVILNGIDFDRLRLSAPGAPEAIRRRYAPGGEFLMLQVARLHPEKGHVHLFRALPEIEQRTGRAVRLLVAGAGPFEEEFRRSADETGMGGSITFTGFRRDIPDLIAAADVLVLPSVAEAFGLVLAEAIYLGTPVVATRVGGIPEVVRDGVDGLLVPPASPGALADALARLIGDPGLRLALSGAGRDRIVRDFGFGAMVGEYESLYEELLAGVPGSTRQTGPSRPPNGGDPCEATYP